MDFSIREVAQIPIENFRLLEILYEIEFSNFERTFSEAGKYDCKSRRNFEQ